MFQVGCHLSNAQGYKRMGEDALRIGANVFQYFSRTPKENGRISPADAAALRDIARQNKFGPLLVHAPSALNPCAKDGQTRELAATIVEEDLAVLEKHLPGGLYVFHPGNHMGQGVQAGIAFIAKMLDSILSADQSTMVLLETMSGKSTEVGARFEELQEILNRTTCKKRMGVCLNICRVYAAGYDIVHDLDGVLQQFDDTVGLGRLYAVHLQDNKSPFASRKDRPAKLGAGSIGLDAVFRIINHPILRGLPFYLETPNDLPGYAREIKLLRQARH